ncbi:MAG TPA: HD domain-containing protein [Longimicrobium sp.]|nr:HD domain-containing protein [Longimicrobium sp.]
MTQAKTLEVRDPIHGFVSLSPWEWDIINHPVFQRLRRIRQLAWTDMVYPGAVHNRFEHSLGVMHIATKMFDQIRDHCADLLRALGFSEAGIEKDRQTVRLAALLHDVGHAPFSHAGEDLMPTDPGTGKPFKHEQYSAALIRELMTDVIDAHRLNDLSIHASDVAELIEGGALTQRKLFWRQIVSSQLDADRADYLLRDSYHLGVDYGRYDLRRVITTLTAVEDAELEAPVLAIEEGGWRAAESLLWARYQMFTQVYLHKTRVAYDLHVGEAMAELLVTQQAGDGLAEPGRFPPPTDVASLRRYLRWTDWRALALIEDGAAGVHGERLLTRRHHRMVYETREAMDQGDEKQLRRVLAALEPLAPVVRSAKSSWYKPDFEIQVARDAPPPQNLVRLSELSAAVRGLTPSNKQMVYVAHEHARDARRIVKGIPPE